MIPVSGGDREPLLQKHSQLEAFQQLGYTILHGGAGDGLDEWQQARDLSFRPGLSIHLCRLRGQAAGRRNQLGWPG
jgi:hypothetical protein